MPKMTYEQSIKRLGEIVALLESGEPELEEAVKLFDEGTKLSLACRKSLDSAKQRISELGKTPV